MKKQFNICEYGACSDGETINTVAIQKAIDACHQVKGGGRVVCGPGTFLTGTLELKSNVELHLVAGCCIKGSLSLEDYPLFIADGFHTERSPEKSAISLIQAINAENIAITGLGKIDGSGLAFYDTSRTDGKLDKPDTPRPRIGMFYQCRSLLIEDITLVDSACWTLWLMQCQEANIHRISISGNRRMRNMDGVDVDSCRNVTISDCRFDTEDDCVAVRTMQALYDTPAVCEDITVTNCVMNSSCQGVRIGCPGDGIIRKCTFSNLEIESENNGIVFDNPHRYLSAGTPGSAHITNVTFSNVVINCRLHPILVRVEDGITLPALADLSFSDFRIHSGAPCLVQGCPETTIRNIHFNTIKLQTTGDDAIICRYCEGVMLTNVELSNRAGNKG